MSCSKVRTMLTRNAAMDATARRHLDECPDCARYASRVLDMQSFLRDHRVDLAPDAGFAARVGERLQREPAEALARAALQLLPAGVALAVLLFWFALRTTPDPASLFVVSPLESPLVWIAERDESGS